MAPVGQTWHMPFVVKLKCQGTARNAHPVRTVAQFRYDDGWGRVHDREKRDQIVWEPDGDMHTVYTIACDLPECDRFKPRSIPSERLHPLLDYNRAHGNTELLLR